MLESFFMISSEQYQYLRRICLEKKTEGEQNLNILLEDNIAYLMHCFLNLIMNLLVLHQCLPLYTVSAN